ncbi:MAG: class I SAM-dependent methyltransferase [Candidatus Aenigmarchaeota archaeon]|nr:class I SAM-dependent methyltransferase [Candidatus Aenigmarchaeota archaeon]
MNDEILLGKISRCQICGGSIEEIVSFGHQAPVQRYLTREQLSEPETTYPLNWHWCSSCGLVQIDYAADPRIVFPKEYPYQSSMTKNLREDFADLAEKAAKKCAFSKNALVVDIGSNDGTLLGNFKKRGFRVLGVEPTNVASIAIKNGIPTVNKFFSENVAEDIVKTHGKASIVTAANVFAHVNNLFPAIRAIRGMLEDDGLFVSESHYLLDLVQKSEYDTIYHEHLRYYSLRPLMRLHEMLGFRVIDAERIVPHGGSIRIYAVKKESPTASQQSPRLQELLHLEEQAGLYKKGTFEQLGKRIIGIRHDLLSILIGIKKSGASIVGISAPARSSMLLGYCHIDDKILDYVVEREGSLKIGLYTPGTHIPIVNEQRLFEDHPEYALILSWHFADELMRKLRQLGYKGRFIMPLPEPGIVDGI